ncbi:MAG: glycosyltransferase family 4 protein [Kofleriaceae bacterium]|nr:glycosyltransferase family 4 protein [Kofleriaceae bacterium]
MTRPLRIGIFVMAFPRQSETFIVTKVLKLIDAGFDVHIFTFQESTQWDAFDVLAGRDDVRARVHVVPPLRPLGRVLSRGIVDVAKTAVTHPRSFARFVRHNWESRAESPFGFAKSIYFRLRFVGHELDILHIEFDSQALGVADLKRYLSCHVLLSARGTFQMHTVLDDIPDAPARMFRYVDGYHFISSFLDNNTRKLGLPAEIPTWQIEPAIDLTLFRPVARPERALGEPLRLISVGRLSWAKGHEFALDAVARLRARGLDVELAIYGAGPYEEAIRYAIKQLHLESCVRLEGAVRREAMPAIYAAADIMVHAAIEEGFCNAVIEAQAMELPVVTFDAGGLPENVEHGVTGFVVPRRDADAMADRLMELASDPDMRRRFGEAGRVRALAKFDLDRQAEAFVRLYTELAALPRRQIKPLADR